MILKILLTLAFVFLTSCIAQHKLSNTQQPQRSLTSAQDQFYQNIQALVANKIDTSFHIRESVSQQREFQFDLVKQTPKFKQNIVKILVEGFSNLYKVSPKLTEQLINKFTSLNETWFQIEAFYKNQTAIPRPIGGTGPLWTYEGGEPDLQFIMKANENNNIGLIIFNYFHLYLDNRSNNWKNLGYPSLFFSDQVHVYNKTTVFHEWLHVLGVNKLENHNNLTFQQKASDPVYSCSNLAFPKNLTPSFKDLTLNNNTRHSITPASCLNCITKALTNFTPE